MATFVSSQRLQPERAPRLRRVAELVERGAGEAAFPERARRLARDMRVRATELELGADTYVEPDDFAAEIRAIGFAA